MKSLLFPPEPRGFPGRRGIKIVLRAIHVLCAAVLTGSQLLGSDPATGADWMRATIATGMALLLLDLHESGVFLLQLRGWLVVAKIAAVALLPALAPQARGWMLAGVLFVSVLSSHAPSRFRYHVPVGGKRLRGATTKG